MTSSSRTRCLLVCMLLLAAGALTSGLAVAGPGTDRDAGAGKAIELNSAGIDELTTIPGIGEAMARRIIEWREEHGPFRRVEDLMKVRGIGETSLEKMRPHVTVRSKQ